ncbi:carbohydrate ABC transporter permease [Jiangella asiatica]|uniref:Carbohydrate ABC transporter permease n=1 Tax=Jiangella asiatica TaxID=2530372 RepID=A0A4R5DLM3_9ACTN|nr:carbohydrate ABC transporter permease [Jiangella asiatica]TDE14337.1 carbohydrate ABC transporter permease [Jiangella asiatica]
MATDQTTSRPITRRRRGGALWPHAVAGLCLAALLYPVLWMVLTSLKPTSEIIAGTSLLPESWTLDNFVQGWDGAGVESFGTFFLNSTIIATAAVVGNVVSCTLAAYAFSRLSFPGRAALFAVVIGILFLPKEVLLIPQYTIFHTLGWTDSFLPLIVPQFLALDAFFVFLSVQFLRGLPRELDEAAVLDGCGPWRRLWHVTLPLIRPAIATTAIFTFIWTWNDYMPQLIYLNSPENYTLSVGLRMFLDATSGSDLGPMSAMSLVSLLPLFVLFVLFQRRLVKGITMTGLK